MDKNIPKGPSLSDLTVIKPASMTDVIKQADVNIDAERIALITEEYKKVSAMKYFISNYSKLQYNNKTEDILIKLLSNINKSGINDGLIENKLLELKSLFEDKTYDYSDQILLAFCLSYLSDNISKNKITNK